jgi:hypothetical protein
MFVVVATRHGKATDIPFTCEYDNSLVIAITSETNYFLFLNTHFLIPTILILVFPIPLVFLD